LIQCFPYVEFLRGFIEFFDFVFSAAAKLTGEFASLEEPTDDPNIVIVLVFLVDRSSSAGSDRRVELENPTQKLRLLIVNSIF
jgi:hypothetical protein